MARKAKTLESMDKHLTREELEAREKAEAELLDGASPLDPTRPPKSIADDPVATRFWKTIVLRAQDVTVMDSLDTEVLAIYCGQLSRREQLQQKLQEEATELLGVKLEQSLQSLEKSLLGYAKELGLTPSSRAGLAKRRAAQAEDDPSADLFG